MKPAFTLIELLIVIGIIGILAGIILGVSGNAFESARAAKCMANLRTLATAANARAMGSSDMRGWYPLAGSREVIGTTKGKEWYNEQVGWISWLSNKGDPYGKRTPGASKPTSHQKIAPSTFYSKGVYADDVFAMTNGTLWRYTGKNAGVYVCPSHSRHWKDRKVEVKWSYVMNMRFGYDFTMGTDAAGTSSNLDWDEYGGVVEYGGGISRKAKKQGDPAIVVNPDRVLMFAELPTVDISADGKVTPRKKPGDDYDSDCTLQYKINIDGWKFGEDWAGATESIGFNHPLGKRERAGHVAFADGHVEKLTYRGGSGLKTTELTALLCEGVDLSNGGKQGWSIIDGQD